MEAVSKGVRVAQAKPPTEGIVVGALHQRERGCRKGRQVLEATSGADMSSQCPDRQHSAEKASIHICSL